MKEACGDATPLAQVHSSDPSARTLVRGTRGRSAAGLPAALALDLPSVEFGDASRQGRVCDSIELVRDEARCVRVRRGVVRRCRNGRSPTR